MTKRRIHIAHTSGWTGEQSDAVVVIDATAELCGQCRCYVEMDDNSAYCAVFDCIVRDRCRVAECIDAELSP